MDTSSNILPSLHPLFVDLVEDVEPLIVKKLDNPSILNALRVCKAWLSNQALLKHLYPIKEDAWCRRERFPRELVETFREKGLSLWKLPELELDLSYEDHGSVGPDWMTAPVMRFTLGGQSGVHLKIKELKATDPSEGVIGLLRINDITHYFDTRLGNSSLRLLEEEDHMKNSQEHTVEGGLRGRLLQCPRCPLYHIPQEFDSTNMYKQISALLSHSYTTYGLAGPVLMIDRPAPKDPSIKYQ